MVYRSLKRSGYRVRAECGVDLAKPRMDRNALTGSESGIVLGFAPLLMFIVGCNCTDGDSDGATVCRDCDDLDPLNYPGGPEVCDGHDNDCDSSVDENVLLAFYRDLDSDGYGDQHDVATACSPPPGYVPISGDCDDSDCYPLPEPRSVVIRSTMTAMEWWTGVTVCTTLMVTDAVRAITAPYSVTPSNSTATAMASAIPVTTASPSEP